jgi:hypothetical protein
MAKDRQKMASAPPLPKIAASNGNGHVERTVKTDECKSLHLTVPSFDWDAGYARRCIDLRLNSQQAEKLKSIQLGLEKQEAQLANGKFVSNATDALRWILENAS